MLSITCYLNNYSKTHKPMERPVFGRKTLHSQRARLDRFVMPRAYLEEMGSRRRYADCDRETVDIWHAKHHKQKKFKSHLNEAFGLEPSKYQESRRSSEEECIFQSWPCVPRTKTYLSSADISILDLPNYSYAAFPDLLDWSCRNFLVAALGRNYHLFGWWTQQVVQSGLTQYPMQCCRFDPRGELLLIGTEMQTVEVHDSLWAIGMGYGRCACAAAAAAPCSITAVDWSPTGNSFAAGCSRGTVNAFDRVGWRTASWGSLAPRGPVRSLRVSPDTRYLALTTLNSRDVHILIWPSLLYHSSLKSNFIVKTINWHPWRSALLGIGALSPNLQTTIALLDTPSAKLKEIPVGTNYILDVMMFSQNTGELVLSLWNPDITSSSYPRTVSQLLVMSDPCTVVDQSGEKSSGLDRVRTMVFSPDGTKLATATADEDLIIWNFLPEEKKKKKAKPRRFHAIPAFIDETTHGFVLRATGLSSMIVRREPKKLFAIRRYVESRGRK